MSRAGLPTAYVEAQLHEQYDALRDRVATSQMYTHEPAEFATAVQAYRQLWGKVGVVADLGPLTTPESRNVVRKVELTGGVRAVVKVIGNTREPGEGELLAEWQRLGLPSVPLISWGYEAVDGNTGRCAAMYVVTKFVDGTPLPRPTNWNDRAAQVRMLIRFIKKFHDCSARVSRVRTWDQRSQLHLRWSLPLIQKHGLQEPAGLQPKLKELSRQGGIIVHGDPAGNNIIESRNGALIALDPPGAIRALREADAAQICSQIGGIEYVADMVHVAWETDPTLDPNAIAFLAGVNLVIWAGYRLADHVNPDLDDTSDDVMAAAADNLRVAAELTTPLRL